MMKDLHKKIDNLKNQLKTLHDERRRALKRNDPDEIYQLDAEIDDNECEILELQDKLYK